MKITLHTLVSDLRHDGTSTEIHLDEKEAYLSMLDTESGEIPTETARELTELVEQERFDEFRDQFEKVKDGDDYFYLDSHEVEIPDVAPELLAWIKTLRDAAMNTPALDSSEDWTALIEQSDALIAKIKGRAS